MSHYKRYPAYKDSGVEWIGDVPEHWEIKRLRHVGSFTNSNVDKKSYEDQEAVRLCNYTDVYYNEFITAGLSFMQATASRGEIEAFSLKKGDVLITKDSEDPADIGIPALVAEELPGVVCGYHLTIIRTSDADTSRFLHRVIQSHPTKAHFFVEAPGITRYGLGQDAIGNLPVCLPPREHRSILADWIDRETARIDALIAKKTRFIELLKEKRQALITKAVTKGLDPNVKMKDSSVEWLGDVPEHWTCRNLGTLANVVRGASPRPAGDPSLFNGDYIPWVTVSEITKDESMFLDQTSTFLTKEGSQFSRTFQAGTLLYSNSGATLGVPKILRIDACANDGVVGFERLSQEADIRFLYFFLTSTTDDLRERIKQGAGQPNLNTEIVRGIKLALPPMAEQQTIVAYLERRLSQTSALIGKTIQSINLLHERRAALITAAVTGQIDLRDSGPQVPQ